MGKIALKRKVKEPHLRDVLLEGNEAVVEGCQVFLVQIHLGTRIRFGNYCQEIAECEMVPRTRYDQIKAGSKPVDEKVRIKEAIKGIFALIAEPGDVIFATGHQFPEDTMKLIESAKKAGIQKIVVTHPHAPIIGGTIEGQKEIMGLEAKLDYVWCNATPYYDWTDPVEYVEVMKSIGVRYIIMSTDIGQPVNPTPPKGMANYILTMMTKGITKAEINIMC